MSNAKEQCEWCVELATNEFILMEEPAFRRYSCINSNHMRKTEWLVELYRTKQHRGNNQNPEGFKRVTRYG